MLHQLKAFVPKPLLQGYHYALARLAAFAYRNPSRELIVIGVTGTNGKTTTAYFIAKALEASGAPTGCTTTAIMKIGDKEWVNKTKMTMPGRFFLQRTLRQMVRAGCRYAVIETSSQGLTQHRHIGIAYDIAVFTNLTPEHLEAHGGFASYKKAKRLLFEYLEKLPPKKLGGSIVPRGNVLNADSPHAAFYETPGVKTAWYGLQTKHGLFAEDVRLQPQGSCFTVNDIPVTLKLPGAYNVENALAALATCQILHVDVKKAAENLGRVMRVPGRFDRVDVGQPWTVVIDYAPEPESFRRLYETLDLIPRKRTIHVLGKCGGGRDAASRPTLGKLAAEKADIVIVTNEDPYDDEPMEIIDQVAAGAKAGGKQEGETLFRILDRRDAIKKAMSLAQSGDLVVMTGKGCETWMCVAGGKKLPWNEQEAAEEAIHEALAARKNRS